MLFHEPVGFCLNRGPQKNDPVRITVETLNVLGPEVQPKKFG